MRIVFMGTPDFAVPCLERILADGHQVVGVFTQPDKPKGRKMELTPPPVKELTLERGIPVFQPEKLRDGQALALFRELAPQLVVVVAYGKILPKDLLEVPPLGCVNVHGSLLPRHRGAAPIQWTLLCGDPVAGVTTMFMDEGMDTGDMILKMEIPVEENETAGALFARLAPLGAECLSRTLQLFAAEDAVPRTPQNGDEATMAPMLSKAMGELDFCKDARTLHNLARGLTPWPGAWTAIDNKTLKIHETCVREGKPDAAPGTLLEAGGALVVACGAGTALELLTVQPEGKTKMPGRAFLLGARIKSGEAPFGAR